MDQSSALLFTTHTKCSVSRIFLLSLVHVCLAKNTTVLIQSYVGCPQMVAHYEGEFDLFALMLNLQNNGSRCAL